MFGIICLIIGGFFEPTWVIAMERATKAQGKMKIVHCVAFLILEFCSMFFLSKGMETISMGISYAVWTAIGAISTIIVSRFLYDEPISAGKVAAVMLILIGISGLEFTGGLS